MQWKSYLAVSGGAAAGATLRWWLSTALNDVWLTVPLGTLAANLVGGLLMGVALAIVSRHAELAPEARLFVTTGFLGGLTTFSTFSAEMSTLIVRQQFMWTALGTGMHVLGSIAMTMLGLAASHAIYNRYTH